jgi:LAO/AO transport system ATPase
MPTVEQLVERLHAGNRRALSRLLTLIENDAPEGRRALRLLYPRSGRAHTIGLTGSAGSGKSTLSGAIAREMRRRGRTLGIVAIDPTSPFSQGALLGDRIRMQDLTSDPGVFLRSMATRGNMGGLAPATAGVVTALDAFGKDAVLVETVGAGQDEVDVAVMADTTVVVLTPGAGDDVQAMKAGMMEIADILVVMANLPNADLFGAPGRIDRRCVAVAAPYADPRDRWRAREGIGALVRCHAMRSRLHRGLDVRERHRREQRRGTSDHARAPAAHRPVWRHGTAASMRCGPGRPPRTRPHAADQLVSKPTSGPTTVFRCRPAVRRANGHGQLTPASYRNGRIERGAVG